MNINVYRHAEHVVYELELNLATTWRLVYRMKIRDHQREIGSASEESLEKMPTVNK